MTDNKNKPDLWMYVVPQPAKNIRSYNLSDGSQYSADVQIWFATLNPGTNEPEFIREYGDYPELHDIVFSTTVTNTNDDAGIPSYRWRVGLASYASSEYPLQLRDLERATKALTKLDKSVTKVSDKFGNPKTFGQYVAYASAGYKVKGIVKKSKKYPNDWMVLGGDVAGWIDSALCDAARECRIANGQTDDDRSTTITEPTVESSNA